MPSSEGYINPDYVMNYGLVGIVANTVNFEMNSVKDGGFGKRLGWGCSFRRTTNSMTELTTLVDKVKAALAQFGYTGEIKVYSQLSWG